MSNRIGAAAPVYGARPAWLSADAPARLDSDRLLFALCLFLSPLPGVVPPQATGAILVLVGFLTMREVAAIRWDNPNEALPAFLIITVMPFTYSITNGISSSFLAFAILELLAGRIHQVPPLMLLASLAFVVYFALGG